VRADGAPVVFLICDISGLKGSFGVIVWSNMQVLLCLQVLSDLVEAATMSPFEKLQMHEAITTFEDVLGGCERLLRTPIPVSYGRHATRFQVIWLSFFPLLMHQELGDSVVPITALMGFIFFGTAFSCGCPACSLQWLCLSSFEDFATGDPHWSLVCRHPPPAVRPRRTSGDINAVPLSLAVQA
jgi:hypothetical protein